MRKTITVEATIQGEIGTVWDIWNGPEQMKQWMHASDDWECRAATNDVQVGGKLVATLAAKDAEEGFDLSGTYTEVDPPHRLAFTMDDGRTVSVTFTQVDDHVHVVETFEMEDENSEALQRAGWQAILDNFKAHVETHVFGPTSVRAAD